MELRLVARHAFKIVFALDSTVDVEQLVLIIETVFASNGELVGMWKRGLPSSPGVGRLFWALLLKFKVIFSLGLYAELAEVWQAFFADLGATRLMIFFGGASESQLVCFCLTEVVVVRREELLEQVCKPEAEDVIVATGDPFSTVVIGLRKIDFAGFGSSLEDATIDGLREKADVREGEEDNDETGRASMRRVFLLDAKGIKILPTF